MQKAEKDFGKKKPSTEASGHGEKKDKDGASRKKEAHRREVEYWERQAEKDPENWYREWFKVQVAEVKAIVRPSLDDQEYWDKPCGERGLTHQQQKKWHASVWADALQQACHSSDN